MSGYSAIKRVLAEFKPYRLPIVLVIGLGFIVSAIQPLCVKLVEHIINELQVGVQPSFYRTIPLALVGIFMVSGIAKFFYNIIRRYISERVILKLRQDIFKNYTQMSLSQLSHKRTGEMLSTLQNDLAQVNVGLETIYDLLKEPIAFVGLLGIAFYCDWKLALCTLIVAPVVVLLFGKSGNAVKKYTTENLKHFSSIISLSQETIVGSIVVKIFRLEKTLIGKFRDIQESFFSYLWKGIKVQEMATPAVELIGAGLMALVLFYGGVRISNGEMTTGHLVAFIVAIGLAQMPIKKLNSAFLKLKVAEAAAERIYKVMDEKTEISDQSTIIISQFKEKVSFKNVGLRYKEKQALSNISFEVNLGESAAFVGQSGGGKSSLVQLIPRIYEVSEGSIHIDGSDIRYFTLDSLRSLISVVTQDTFLFNETIYENIRYGNLNATDGEVKKAIESAHCNFAYDLPDGLKTYVGDRGSRLSGGERQRVAIARAILKGAPILILDEATSNLDSKSENIVQKALETLMKDKTCFMVAHRLSTIKKANKIYVVDSGGIHERGTHDELIGLGGRYQKLVEQQALNT